MTKATALKDGIPSTMGRYHILGRIAAGGMAEVFLAKLLGPSGFERVFVIKRILPHLASQTEFVEMFLDEARLAAAIRHRNVAQVTELCHEDGELFIAMEYLAGETLSAIFRKLRSLGKRLNAGLCAHIISEACAGLHAAHELTNIDGEPLNVVHRDISPQNIFITYSGTVKLLDFGVAKAAGRITDTSTGQMKGKFSYMSPEQCLREPIDRRSDLFALGTVLYEISTGQRLFAAENPIQSLEAICRLPIAKPSERAEGFPTELEKIILKALERDPEQRFQNATELRRPLAKFVNQCELPGLPEELLAGQMESFFSERMLEKDEMLKLVRSGSDIGYIPDAQRLSEIDVVHDKETVSASVLSPKNEAPELSGIHTPKPLPPESISIVTQTNTTTKILFILAGLLLAGGVWALLHQAQTTPAKSKNLEAENTQKPGAPSTSQVSIVTQPAGAEISIDGIFLGQSPLKLDLKKIDKTSKLEIRHEGYEPIERVINQKADLNLDVSLRPIRALKPTKSRSKRRSKRPKSRPTEEKPIEFERFD